jgi:hypothetical protein
MDFEFAGIAGSGIDLADGQRAAEDAQDLVVQPVDLALGAVFAGRLRRLGEDAGAEDVAKQWNHRSTPL